MGPLRIDMCPTCEGSWWEAEELSRVLSLDEPLEFLVGSSLEPILVADKTQALDLSEPACCPVCQVVMERYRYQLVSDVVVDRCPQHGLWLDDGELSGIVEYYRGGRDPERQSRLQKVLHDLAEMHDRQPQLGNWLQKALNHVFRRQ
jgi:Zn-finger nucleic acid-binding protein